MIWSRRQKSLSDNMDFKKELSELIKKQIVILGSDTVMAKVKNVSGLEVSSDGEVTRLEGDPKVVLEKLIDEFLELSNLIVKKTMETLESPQEKPEVSGAPVSSETPVVPSTPAPEAPKTEFPVPSADPKIGETAPTGLTKDEKPIDPPMSPDAKMDLEKIATEVNKAAEQAAMNKPANAAFPSDKPAEQAAMNQAPVEAPASSVNPVPNAEPSVSSASQVPPASPGDTKPQV